MANVRIEGLRELDRALAKLDDRIQRNVLNRSVSAGARVIRDEARILAPVEEGRLKRNIITKKRRGRKGQSNWMVGVRGINESTGNSDTSMKSDDPKNAFYGRFVEFGTSKMSPRPFMTPAYESKRRDAVEVIKQTLREGINRESRGLA